MIKNEYMKLSRDASHRSSRVNISSNGNTNTTVIKTDPNQGDDLSPIDGGGSGGGVTSNDEQGKVSCWCGVWPVAPLVYWSLSQGL